MKRIKLLILIILSLLLLALPAFAVNTITTGGATIEASAIDSDWDPDPYYVHSIMFIPGAANDIMVIKQASASGPVLFYAYSSDGEPRVMYFFKSKLDLFLDYSDCTLNAGAKVIVTIGDR